MVVLLQDFIELLAIYPSKRTNAVIEVSRIVQAFQSVRRLSLESFLTMAPFAEGCFSVLP